MVEYQELSIVLYISSLFGIAGSIWILQEKRLPDNVFASLIYALGIVDFVIAMVFGYLTTNYQEQFESSYGIGVFIFLLFLAFVYYFVNFSLSFIPIYILMFKGTVRQLNKIPLVFLSLVGSVMWTLIISVATYNEQYLFTVLGFVFLYSMFASSCFCFSICWKELNSDKIKRQHVQSLRNFDEREYYSKQASVKMARFSGNFALVQLVLILPYVASNILNGFTGWLPFLDNLAITMTDISQYIMVISFSSGGFFHSLAIHFSLFYVYKKRKSELIPLEDRNRLDPESSTLLDTTVKEVIKPEMVHLFTGQRPLQQRDTIDLIKA
ncbi:hypothetical protein HDV06_003083 [Boothiomyces sp. JEL0866]|nr:hypothetical protein HDV06_000527 [Boothiomyces sp. JEL0866]KAJ3322363.1 hypothetical protein HDV06_003083 [Boothiomyces sp. JEL0866]